EASVLLSGESARAFTFTPRRRVARSWPVVRSHRMRERSSLFLISVLVLSKWSVLPVARNLPSEDTTAQSGSPAWPFNTARFFGFSAFFRGSTGSPAFLRKVLKYA